jgi:hypothetical protein
MRSISPLVELERSRVRNAKIDAILYCAQTLNGDPMVISNDLKGMVRSLS